MTRPPPLLLPSDALAAAKDLFGAAGDCAVSLGSERDQAWLLSAGGVQAGVLKVSNAGEQESTLEMEAEAVRLVAALEPDLPLALPLLSHTGDAVASVSHNGSTHWVRCYPVLPGRSHSAEDGTLSDATLRAWGAASARLGRALRSFSHPAAGSRRLPWDVRWASSLRPLLVHVADAQTRSLCAAALDVFDGSVQPALPRLRHQVVHGDLNLGNVLLDGERITGIVDWGDACFTALVIDIAAVLANLGNAHIGTGGAEVLRMARVLLDGYIKVVPLEDAEAALLGDVWLVRCAVEVLLSSWRVATGLEGPERSGPDLQRFAAQMTTLLALGPGGRASLSAPGPPPSCEPLSALVARRAAVIGPGSEALSYGAHPVCVDRGEGTWLWDADGVRYLDAYNNVPCVGHAHPRVAAAIAAQARRVNVNMRYLHPSAVSLAERLVASCPDTGLDTVLFCNSGSEANDLAWRIARCATGCEGALCTRWAYHGVTAATVALSPETAAVAGHLPRHVERWAPPEAFRGLYGDTAEFAAALERLASKGLGLACAIMDGVLCSEQICALEPGYMRDICGLTRAAGGLWVADEVQSGHGRTGAHMWAFQAWGISPDIVTLGKPMGNGHPVAAVLTRRALADAFVAQEGVFFSTFGGNPVSVAAAHAVLDVLRDERILPRVLCAGEALRAALRAVTAGYPCDVRGVGLVNAVEFVTDLASKRPDPEMASHVKAGLRARGVLVGTTGEHSNALKIRPPLAFTAAEVPFFAQALAGALAAPRTETQ